MSRVLPVAAPGRGMVGGIRGWNSVCPDGAAGRGLLDGGDALASARPSLRPALNQSVIQVQTPKFFLIKYCCSARLVFRRRLVPGGMFSRREWQARYSDQLIQLSLGEKAR